LLLISRLTADADAPLGRDIDGVLEEVPEDLLETDGVGIIAQHLDDNNGQASNAALA
jgi:hypothetical protein